MADRGPLLLRSAKPLSYPPTFVLNPYFETMVAPVLANKFETRLGSETYLGPAQNATKCVIGRRNPLAVELDQSYFIGSELYASNQCY